MSNKRNASTKLLITFSLLTIFFLSNALALTISQDSGFYPETITTSITVASGNIIKYTLDGTNPLTNGILVNSSIFLGLPITAKNSTPSTFAMNPETSLYPFAKPTSTIKTTVLRAIEINPSNKVVNSVAKSYFIGLSPSDFTVPVFSIVIDDKDIQSNETGMFVKGDTYYKDLALEGGNPQNPFRPANWNNDSLRWPASFELFLNGIKVANDDVSFYTSGRWSAALPKKSVKIKYDKKIGAAQTNLQFFGNQSPTTTTKIWLKNGGQDFNGLGLRDCIAGEAVTGLNVETSQCAQAVLFINGEYYGAMNIQQDLDAKYFANRYGINKDDVVVLSQDGLIEEGLATDNQPYFALRNWLRDPTTNLSNTIQYTNFTNQVNIDSLIDYYSIQMFTNNKDFPNDHILWRNKNPSSQVPNTPYDGKWHFQPKDLDQTAGLYSHILPQDDTVKLFMEKDPNGWGHILFLKAMENPDFKQQLINRNLELMDTYFSGQHWNSTIDTITNMRRPEVDKDKARWEKPYSWEKDVIAIKNWYTLRAAYYPAFILNLNSTITLPRNDSDQNNTNFSQGTCSINELNTYCINGAVMVSDVVTNNCRDITCEKTGVQITMRICNQTNVVIPQNNTNTTNNTGSCYNSVDELAVTCNGGNISYDVFMGTCRKVICGSRMVQACNKQNGTNFEMYDETWNNSAAQNYNICFGPQNNSICMDNYGFLLKAFPVCS